MNTDLFARLLEGRPGYRVDTDRFWTLLEQIPAARRSAPPTLRDLLALRYARDGAVRQTRGEIAHAYGITQERVRQKETSLLNLLRLPAIFRVYAYRDSPAEASALDASRPLAFPPSHARQTRYDQPLSRREQEVLNLLARGLSNREIAESFGLARATVKVHTRNIYIKINVRSRLQAIAWAQAHGFETMFDKEQNA